MIVCGGVSSFSIPMISVPISLVENESPVPGLKINPSPLVAIFFLSLMFFLLFFQR
jgi:hypothetical protein